MSYIRAYTIGGRRCRTSLETACARPPCGGYVIEKHVEPRLQVFGARGHAADCNLGDRGKDSVFGGVVRGGVKGCSASAGDERSGTGETSIASSRSRSSNSQPRPDPPKNAGTRGLRQRGALRERHGGTYSPVRTAGVRPPWSRRGRGLEGRQASRVVGPRAHPLSSAEPPRRRQKMPGVM
eukprot:5686130-Pleurochrysis_carterae.AAC.2